MIDFVKKNKYALYAILLLLPTFATVRVEFYLLFILTVFTLEFSKLLVLWHSFRKRPFSKQNLVVWVVFFIMLFSFLNKLMNGREINCTKDYYGSFYLFPFLLLTAKVGFDKKIFKYILLITAIEIIVAIGEYGVGTRTFLLDIGERNVISDYNLLYNSRVFGLSVNSSVLALKVLIAFFIIDFVKFKPYINWLLRIILLIGLLISFSRIIILVLLIYWFTLFLIRIIKTKGKMLWKSKLPFYGIVLIISLIFQANLKSQLLRGDHQSESAFITLKTTKEIKITPLSCNEIGTLEIKQGELDVSKQKIGDKLMMKMSKVQSSGRKLIWLNYMNYIDDHLFLGNGSDKLMLRVWVEKEQSYKLMHAHNSFLMLLSTNGILITLMYLVLYLLLFKSRNHLVIGAIILYSLGNYGVFWGFSYFDFIFVALLMFRLKPAYDD